MARRFAPDELPCFVCTPGERYCCGRCCRILLPPVRQSPCGHRFCHRCVRLLFDGHQSTPCPVNDADCPLLVTDQLHPDFAMERELKHMEVWCRYYSDGCRSTLQWRALAAHVNQCGYDHRICKTENCQLNEQFVKIDSRISRIEKEQEHARMQVSHCKQAQTRKEREVKSIEESIKNGVDEVRKTTEDEIQGMKREHALLAIAFDRVTRELATRLQNLESTNPQTMTEYWLIPDYTTIKENAKNGANESLQSPPFYTASRGYKLCLRLFPNGTGTGENTHVSLYFVLMKGEFDAIVPWPFRKTVSLIIEAKDRASSDVSCVYKNNPANEDSRQPTHEKGTAFGNAKFALQSTIESGGYLVNDTLTIKVRVSDRPRIRSG